MTENEAFIVESIFNQVRMGFLSISSIKENIIEEIEDNEFEDEISEDWAYEVIDKEYNKLLKESSNWKRPTDTEKLIIAFDELCSKNIIALHNAGFTNSDGEYEVVEVERSLRAHKITSEGYCFYHEQDLSRAIMPDNPSLYLSFQKVDNSDEGVTLNIGRKVTDVLRKNGFEVVWNEDVNRKILIKNFKWQYRFDETSRDLQNYDKVVELMLKSKSVTTESNDKKYLE